MRIKRMGVAPVWWNSVTHRDLVPDDRPSSIGSRIYRASYRGESGVYRRKLLEKEHWRDSVVYTYVFVVDVVFSPQILRP